MWDHLKTPCTSHLRPFQPFNEMTINPYNRRSSYTTVYVPSLWVSRVPLLLTIPNEAPAMVYPEFIFLLLYRVLPEDNWKGRESELGFLILLTTYLLLSYRKSLAYPSKLCRFTRHLDLSLKPCGGNSGIPEKMKGMPPLLFKAPRYLSIAMCYAAKARTSETISRVGSGYIIFIIWMYIRYGGPWS